MLSSYCVTDFQGGNRLFLFLPLNLHFISFSASSLSQSKALSPSGTHFHFSSLCPCLTLPQHATATTISPPSSHLQSSLVFTFSFLSLFSLFFAFSVFVSFLFSFLYKQSGTVIFLALTHSVVYVWKEGRVLFNFTLSEELKTWFILFIIFFYFFFIFF